MSDESSSFPWNLYALDEGFSLCIQRCVKRVAAVRKFNAEALYALALLPRMPTSERIGLKLEVMLTGGGSCLRVHRYTFGFHAWIAALLRIFIVELD